MAANTGQRLETSEERTEDCDQQSPACGPPGKPEFISTPEAGPSSRPDCFIKGLKGYGSPSQHPLFTTTNSNYGRFYAPQELNPKIRPKNSKFSTSLNASGMYKDTHFTTSLD
ncbi:hypothetical protein BsWGS_19449 [Bradybaena similaris]